jgi:hypothetical protein
MKARILRVVWVAGPAVLVGMGAMALAVRLAAQTGNVALVGWTLQVGFAAGYLGEGLAVLAAFVAWRTRRRPAVA